MSGEGSKNEDVTNNKPIIVVSHIAEITSSGQAVILDSSQFDSISRELAEVSNNVRQIKSNTRRPSGYERAKEAILFGIVGGLITLVLGYLLGYLALGKLTIIVNPMLPTEPSQADQLRAVLALGVVAGVLASVQVWVAPSTGDPQGRASLFGDLRGSSHPNFVKITSPLQNFLVTLVLVSFSFYLALAALAWGFQIFDFLNQLFGPAKFLSDLVFLMGSFVLVLAGVVAVVRIVASRV